MRECMICGAHKPVLSCEKIQLCHRCAEARKSPLSWGRFAAELVSSNPTPGPSAACPVDADTGNLSAGTGDHPSGMNSGRGGSNWRSPACPESFREGAQLGVG